MFYYLKIVPIIYTYYDFKNSYKFKLQSNMFRRRPSPPSSGKSTSTNQIFMCAYRGTIDKHGTCNIVQCFTVTQPYKIIPHNEAKRNRTTMEVLSSAYVIRPEAITTRSIALPAAASMGVNL
jgi:hypothetical protein